MVKFLKSNKAVILLQGWYVGRKVVIVKVFEQVKADKERAYGHCLVAKIKKYPGKVVKRDSVKKMVKKSWVKCFIKLVNLCHIMPTCYTLDGDLKDVISSDSLVSNDKKVVALN